MITAVLLYVFPSECLMHMNYGLGAESRPLVLKLSPAYPSVTRRRSQVIYDNLRDRYDSELIVALSCSSRLVI